MTTFITKPGYCPEKLDFGELAGMSRSALTLANYREWELSWEEYGYEWSVFEKDPSASLGKKLGTSAQDESEKKIWEGFKYIYSSKPNAGEIPALDLGNI